MGAGDCLNYSNINRHQITTRADQAINGTLDQDGSSELDPLKAIAVEFSSEAAHLDDGDDASSINDTASRKYP